jgi:phage gp36-like protein
MLLGKLPPKRPIEEYFIEFDFSKWLSETTIVTAVITVLDSTGTNVTAALTDSTQQSNTDTSVNVFIKGGISGETYEISCLITDSAGEVLGPLSKLLTVQETADVVLPTGNMYCAIADIAGRIGETTLTQLTDDLGAGGIDEQLVAKAIIAAGATIDAYCQKYYTTPLSPIPPKIAELCVDITVYDLYSRSDLAMPEIRKDRNDAAIRFLEKVSDGKIDLGVSTPSPAETSNHVEIVSSRRNFKRSNLRDF